MNFKLFACLVAVIKFIYAYSNKDGDNTIYGLACDSCNDPTILLLTNNESNHVKYEKHVTNEIINIKEQKGILCYMIMLKMRYCEKISMNNIHLF